MNKRFFILVVLAAVHLVLVVCGTQGISLLPENNGAGNALRLGRAMTGSDNNFGFFAPEVGPDMRASFTLIDASGHSWTEDLDMGNNLEARLRVNNILSLFLEMEIRRAAAGSLAGVMFARYPEVQTVIVHIDVHDPPTMEEVREGDLPEWELFYEATVSRDQERSLRAEL